MKTHFLTTKAFVTFKLLSGNLIKTCWEPTRYACVWPPRFICLHLCVLLSHLLAVCLEYVTEMLWWTCRCLVQTRCGRGSHKALMRERRSKLSFGWESLAGWSHTYHQQKTGVLHRRSRINLILSTITIILYPQHVRPHVRLCICCVLRSLYSSKP